MAKINAFINIIMVWQSFTLDNYSPYDNHSSWMIIHPMTIIHPGRLFTPDNYSLLDNHSPWTMIDPNNHSPLIIIHPGQSFTPTIINHGQLFSLTIIQSSTMTIIHPWQSFTPPPTIIYTVVIFSDHLLDHIQMAFNNPNLNVFLFWYQQGL